MLNSVVLAGNLGGVIENECPLENSRNMGVGESGFSCFLGFWMMQIIFRNIQSGGIEFRGKQPNFMPHIKNRLLGRGNGCGKLPVVALIPEPQGTLEAS